MTGQAGIGGVEAGVRNFKPVPLLLEKIQGLCPERDLALDELR